MANNRDDAHQLFTKSRCTANGAFFTPMQVAQRIVSEISTNTESVLFAYANTGVLPFVLPLFSFGNVRRVVCVEPNKELYEMGKKLVPDVKWINDSIFTMDIPDNPFDAVVADIPTILNESFLYKGDYTGDIHEYKVIDTLGYFGRTGYYSLPSTLAGFISNIGESQLINSPELFHFQRETGLTLEQSFTYLSHAIKHQSRELVICKN